jgi:hypothetical protein
MAKSPKRDAEPKVSESQFKAAVQRLLATPPQHKKAKRGRTKK